MYINTSCYQRAKDHHRGQGIQDGIDIETTLGLVRSMRKPKQQANKATLENIITGAKWRVAMIKASETLASTCLRCGLENKDSFRCLWTCPENDEIDSEYTTNDKT